MQTEGENPPKSLKWTTKAESDLENIYDLVASTFSNEVAESVYSSLIRRAIQLTSLPFSGYVVPGYEDGNTRAVNKKHCRLIYQISDDEILILRVLDMRMDHR